MQLVLDRERRSFGVIRDSKWKMGQARNTTLTLGDPVTELGLVAFVFAPNGPLRCRSTATPIEQ